MLLLYYNTNTHIFQLKFIFHKNLFFIKIGQIKTPHGNTMEYKKKEYAIIENNLHYSYQNT